MSLLCHSTEIALADQQLPTQWPIFKLRLTRLRGISTDPSLLQTFAVTYSSLLIFAHPSSYPLSVPKYYLFDLLLFLLDTSFQHELIHFISFYYHLDQCC